MPDNFEQFVDRTIAHELSAREHSYHPALSLFLDDLAGDLSPTVRSQLHAHLATCPQCLEKWRALEQALKEEQSVLEEKTKTLAMPEILSQIRKEKRFSRISAWLLHRSPLLRPALALVPVALFLVFLGVTLPMLHQSNARIVALTEEVKQLRDEISSITSEIAFIPSVSKISPSWEEIKELAFSAQQMDDPWVRAVFVASYFSAHGWRLPKELDWSRLRAYQVKPGDSWESIAERELGDETLGPVLYLVNGARDLVPGKAIVVPEKHGGE
jgi:hypothetical protein